MTKEELKNKYSAFITEISEILGLGKPVDILKLCATTDLFFQPLEKRIADLEETNAKLQAKIDDWQSEYIEYENFKNNEIAELKAQIEKMKCCHNCKKFHNLSYDCTCAEVCNEWELAD